MGTTVDSLRGDYQPDPALLEVGNGSSGVDLQVPGLTVLQQGYNERNSQSGVNSKEWKAALFTFNLI